MIPDELRITDAEVDMARRYPTCRACLNAKPAVDDCAKCASWGTEDDGFGVRLSRGASARIGSVIVGALPHLRHAAWPPARSKHPLASVLGMIGALS